jgi:hypothetical protein
VCKTPHDSEFCDDERFELAHTQTTIYNAAAYSSSKEVREGRDDHLLRRWRDELAADSGQPVTALDGQAERELTEDEIERELRVSNA